YTSMESLSRLIHPQKGFISPLVFIRIAEKEGIIDKVDMLQMERICNYLEEHRDLMDTLENVKFNLSPAAIIMHGYIENLIDIIRRHNLPVKWFQFEITENMPTEYNVETLHTIKMLQENGASMCLDDFGSGYANFSSVLKMPFDTIKIDKSLFDYVEEDEKVRLLCSHTVKTLKDCGFKVVGEGIEKKNVKDLAVSWGIDMIQGYYYSKPVPMNKIEEVLKGEIRAD
ncbi:MAG: EAL domain-containing protein, partial [Erysipelotrichaceae bacterium]|nr:EAL domain-containing protein [Erysipelotrichaceae bacterium]